MCRKDNECRTVYGHDSSFFKSAYVIWFDSIAWLLPSLVSAFFYWKVVATVWKSKRSLNEIQNCTVNSKTLLTHFPSLNNKKKLKNE